MLAGMCSLHGELGEAARLCRETLAGFDCRRAELGHRVPYSAELGLELAEILIERNELDEAAPILEENLALARWTASHVILTRGHLALARLAAARGDPAAAFDHLDEAETVTADGAAQAGAARVGLWLSLSDQHPEYLELARQWGRAHCLTEFGAGPPQTEWTIALARARLLLADGAAGPETLDLLGWLERQQRAMHARGWAHWEIRLAVLEALARRQRGDGPGARAALRRALELGAPGGYVRVFVDGGKPLRRLWAELDDRPTWLTPVLEPFRPVLQDGSVRRGAAPGPATAVAAKMIEPLTSRECEVLLLLCQGLSNQGIAEKLVVTLSTVKKHNNSIFGKLGVASRAEAIVRARQLGLID
jgi:LuxR family maltose regulon positive regulatory protein